MTEVVRGQVIALGQCRPLEAWVRDLREAVAHSEHAKVVTPDGQSFSAKEWLEAYDAEARNPGSGSP